MPPPPRPLMHLPPTEILTTEIALFLLITVLSLVIYYKTKELYDLTKHQGIFHFRNIFLFFALAYLFRFIHLLLLQTENLSRLLHASSLFAVSYFSTLAILSIAATILIRYLNFSGLSLLMHTITFTISALTFITRSHPLLIILQTAMFLIALLLAFTKSHNLTKNRITYLALFAFWTLSTLAFTKRLFPLKYKIPLYALSAITFIYVYYRVNKNVTKTR